MSSENEFDTGDSGALNTELAEAGRMKPGSLIIMKEQWPCKVTAFTTAKDVFTDKQYDETFGTGDMIPRPIVTKTEVTGLSYDDEGSLTLMMPDGELKEDLNLPTEAHLSDISTNIKRIIDAGTKECLVTYQTWGDKQQVVAVREGQDQ